VARMGKASTLKWKLKKRSEKTFDWIRVSQDRDLSWGLVNTVMSFLIS
jgi:hypothetical protein